MAQTPTTGTRMLVSALKAELKAANMTYANLAQALGMAESSVKRMLSRGDMTLARVDAICRILKIEFADLAQRVAQERPLCTELTLTQEEAVVADRVLLLVAICCLSQWSVRQIVQTYRVSEAQVVRCLGQLDRLGIIELHPLNRYRLKVAKTFRWRAQGPVMAFFRAEVVPDYFQGEFDGEGELLTLVHGRLSPAQAHQMVERLQRLAQDFASQHHRDAKVNATEPAGQGYAMVLGLQSWLFAGFRDLLRSEGLSRDTAPAGHVVQRIGRRR